MTPKAVPGSYYFQKRLIQRYIFSLRVFPIAFIAICAGVMSKVNTAKHNQLTAEAPKQKRVPQAVELTTSEVQSRDKGLELTPFPFHSGDEVQVGRGAIVTNSADTFKKVKDAVGANDTVCVKQLLRDGGLKICLKASEALVLRQNSLDWTVPMYEVRILSGELMGTKVWVKSQDLKRKKTVGPVI